MKLQTATTALLALSATTIAAPANADQKAKRAYWNPFRAQAVDPNAVQTVDPQATDAQPAQPAQTTNANTPVAVTSQLAPVVTTSAAPVTSNVPVVTTSGAPQPATTSEPPAATSAQTTEANPTPGTTAAPTETTATPTTTEQTTTVPTTTSEATNNGTTPENGNNGTPIAGGAGYNSTTPQGGAGYNGTTPQGGAGYNSTNPQGGAGTGNGNGSGNGASGAAGAGAAGAAGATFTNESGKVLVIYTGGDLPSNESTSTYDLRVLYNTTNPLNLTELYNVSSAIKAENSQNNFTGTVIVGATEGLEALGFFNSITTNFTTPLVVTDDINEGLIVANDPYTLNQSRVTVVSDNVITPGAYAANSNGCPIEIGTVGTDNGAHWLFTDLVVGLNNRVNNDFPQLKNDTNATVSVPIISGDSGLILSNLQNISGLVIDAQGTNFTDVNLSGVTVPVVITSPNNAYVAKNQIPANAIQGGNLDATKAQILLSVALANNVTDVAQLQNLFA